MKKWIYVLLLFVFLCSVYLFWSGKDRVHSTESFYPRYVIENLESYGENKGNGNVLALSPYLHTYDFSSQDAFYNMLNYYISLAQRKKLIKDSTILVLPEYIGTWLVVAEEKKAVYSDTSINTAMRTMIFSNLGKFGRAYAQSSSTDKTTEAIFKMKAEKMLHIYQTCFSKLAKTNKITIAAGSIVLPEPSVTNGKIVLKKSGKLYNISAVFGPDGNVQQPLTKKIFPIEAEKSFTASENRKEIPVYKSNAGNFAILICADAWYPSRYEVLKNKEIDILLVPSFVSGNNSWTKKWEGYSGAPAPKDIDTTDVGYLTEREAWLKYAMTNRISSAKIKTGVNVFLRGEFWNIGSDGHTLIWNNKAIESKKTRDKAGSLINVWL